MRYGTRRQPRPWKAIHRYRVGDLAIAQASGKRRPVVLVQPSDQLASEWLVLPLTGQSHYKTTGEARQRVKATASNGLWSDGYLQTTAPRWIPAEALYHPIGSVDGVLVLTISRQCRLTPTQLDALWAAAGGPTWGKAG